MAITDFESKVDKYIESRALLEGVSCIIIGLSGGPDSCALVNVLKSLSGKKDGFPQLFAVHINHGLRPEAAEDENLSKELCQRLEVPFKAFHFDVRGRSAKLHRGLEETGRIMRYEAFRECAAKEALRLEVSEESIRIATAHHKGDLTETFLMNLFRGSGLDGLTAMNSDKTIIRPLLDVSKSEILDYLEQNKISYAVDETNLSTDYTRNKWRNSILPEIARVSVKSPEDAVSDTYRLLCADEDFINKHAQTGYSECLIIQGGYRFLKIPELMRLHTAVRTRVIRLYWKDCFGNLTDFESKHISILTGLMDNTDGVRFADMPFGRKAVCQNGFLGLYEGDITGLSCSMSSYSGFPAVPVDFDIHITRSQLLAGPASFDLPGTPYSLEASIVVNNDSMVYNTFSWICAENQIDIGLCPQEGTFRNAGSLHRSDIKKLMSDRKVPRDARSRLIAARSGGRVLWIPGIGHADGFVSPESRERWLEQNKEMDGESLIRLDIVDKGETVGKL